MASQQKCYLTDAVILDSSIHDFGKDICYSIRLDDVDHFITICKSCLDVMLKDKNYSKYKVALRSLMMNGKLGDISIKRFHWDSDETGIAKDKMVHFSIKAELDSMTYPKRPKEKLENFFKALHDFQNYEGEQIELPNFLKMNTWGKWYFENHEEALFYLKALEKQGNIELDSMTKEIQPSFHFTYDGLNKYIQLFEEGYNSKYCFVAMAFDQTPELKDVRDAIKQALSDTGFEPYIVDEKYLESEQTINDAIIAGLKQSKFCIADFCFHKNGVYFESGYALGQGKQVIYTCSQKEFKDTHFDTNHFQHIIYETPTELHKRLVDKIEAWVK